MWAATHRGAGPGLTSPQERTPASRRLPPPGLNQRFVLPGTGQGGAPGAWLPLSCPPCALRGGFRSRQLPWGTEAPGTAHGLSVLLLRVAVRTWGGWHTTQPLGSDPEPRGQLYGPCSSPSPGAAPGPGSCLQTSVSGTRVSLCRPTPHPPLSGLQLQDWLHQGPRAHGGQTMSETRGHRRGGPVLRVQVPPPRALGGGKAPELRAGRRDEAERRALGREPVQTEVTAHSQASAHGPPPAAQVGLVPRAPGRALPVGTLNSPGRGRRRTGGWAARLSGERSGGSGGSAEPLRGPHFLAGSAQVSSPWEPSGAASGQRGRGRPPARHILFHSRSR